MTLYETIFIIHPDQAGRAKEFLDTFKKLIEGLGATVIQVEEWGIRETVVRDCTTERARAVSATTARHMKALDTVLGAEEHGFDYRP